MKLATCILLLGLSARAQDAGTGLDVVDVHRAVVDVRLADGGAGERVVVVGGCWLSDRYCVGYAAELAEKRGRVQYLEEHSADAPKLWLIGALLVGGAIGAVGGFELARNLR